MGHDGDLLRRPRTDANAPRVSYTVQTLAALASRARVGGFTPPCQCKWLQQSEKRRSSLATDLLARLILVRLESPGPFGV